MKDTTQTYLGGILLLALTLRLVFVFWGAEYIYGPDLMYKFNDSDSYTGFKTYLEHGIYSFDLTHPDARFGRMPGYPLFWGIHYVLFGEGVWKAIAISQAVLDSLSTLLVFLIVQKVSSTKAGLVSAVIHAVYPFSIMWVSITGTETVATFLMLSFFALLFSHHAQLLTTKSLVALGFLAGYGLLTREYLGLLLFCGLGYLFAGRASLRSIAILTVAFTLTYSIWPLRNLISHDQLVLIRPQSTGYHEFEPDVYGVMKWFVATQRMDDRPADDALKQVMRGHLNYTEFASESDRELAIKLASQAPVCGRGFYFRKHRQPLPSNQKDCTDEIALGFVGIANNYRAAHPFRYYVEIPFTILKKAFLKSDLVAGETPAYVRFLFFLRTLTLVFGLIGFYLMGGFRTPFVLFVVPLHVFWMYIVRFLEMRYLVQSDVLMICGAGVALLWCFNCVGRFLTKRVVNEDPL